MSTLNPASATSTLGRTPTDFGRAVRPPAKARRAGVELMRGVAAYGVIVIHVGLVGSGVLSLGMNSLQSFFGLLCVPFFLAASFYFAALSSSESGPFLPWLKQRAWRLLVPYTLWSVIYTMLQVVEVVGRHDSSGGLGKLLSDPVGRIFFGASGMALYFLPLLFVGLVTMKILRPFFVGRSLVVLGLGLGVALFLSWEIDVTGNDFDLGTDCSFQPFLTNNLGLQQGHFWAAFFPVRLILVVVAHAVRCLPYIFLGWICARFGPSLVPSMVNRVILVLAFIALIVLASMTALPFPPSLIGYSALLLALVLPVPENATWIGLLGRYSFAVYLMHQVLLEGVKMAARNHAFTMDLVRLVPLTLAVFAAANLIAYLADRFGGQAGRILMALPEPTPKR